jgi:hypothetical protein
VGPEDDVGWLWGAALVLLALTLGAEPVSCMEEQPHERAAIARSVKRAVVLRMILSFLLE